MASSINFRAGRFTISTLTFIAALVIAVLLVLRFLAFDENTPLLRDSTFGELAIWIAAQSSTSSPQSILGQAAQALAQSAGLDALSESSLLMIVRGLLLVWISSATLLLLLGLFSLLTGRWWERSTRVGALILFITMLFIIPTLENDNTLGLILAGSGLLIISLITAPGRLTRLISFVLVLSIIWFGWETSKILAAAINYKVTVSAGVWHYTTYDTLDDALIALETGAVPAVITDRSAVRDSIRPYPGENPTPSDDQAYQNLRYITNLRTDEALLGIFPIEPAFPGRLAVVVSAEQAAQFSTLADLRALEVAAITGEFAHERYLSAERNLVLLDLKILNDVNLPHLQNIGEALLQPARRNGPLLLVRILTDAALHTWSEALMGFVIGALLGFILGTVFAHSTLFERGLLPYVVASQTVPILAIAPMVVIWLGAGTLAVAVISAYLTFFPVTINTLRGLRSPHPNALELMHSYAASQWEIMWKLRFPAALPYIFTALKVSATASVVGAIIGELPSSIRSGLGRAILDFSSDYSLVSTPKLWAAILIAASVGIIFFLLVSLGEYVTLRRYVREQ
jgi:NitT/TauT family transport system permease protein